MPWMDVPPEIDLDLLYSSTGEDKGDDVNFAIGVLHSAAPEAKERTWRAVSAWLTAERCSQLLGCPCQVVVFPKLLAVNVLAKGLLRTAGFDRQGKSTGRRLLLRLRSERRGKEAATDRSRRSTHSLAFN